MKKNLFTFLLLALCLTGCQNGEKPSTSNTTELPTSSSSTIEQKNATIISPKGTPAIAISNYAINHQDDVELVAGPDALVAAFTGETKDIIVAPINLGAMRYNSGNTTYRLYRTIVWDNLYVVSRTKINSIEDLKDKDITSFGKGSTPQIVLETIFNHANFAKDKITYTDNVVSALSMFNTSQADIVISAQPNVSSLTPNDTDLFVTSLSTFWKDATNLETYPQSGIFVKNDSLNQIKDTLTAIDEQYNTINENVENTAKNAAQLLEMPEALLKKAIPNCGYKVVEDEFTYVKGYYQAMIDLGLDKAVGGKLPDENFYITK